MASLKLPAPGTRLGPCLDDCTHPECAADRRLAAHACPLCAEPIGYERRFGFDIIYPGQWVHEACLSAYLTARAS